MAAALCNIALSSVGSSSSAGSPCFLSLESASDAQAVHCVLWYTALAADVLSHS